MKSNTDSTVVTKSVMNGIRAELANAVLQSGQTCDSTGDTVADAFPKQIYMAVKTTAGSATDFVTTTDGAPAQITLAHSRTLNNTSVIPTSYPLLEGFTARFTLLVAKSSDGGAGVGNEGFYYLQFNSNLQSGAGVAVRLPARRIAYMNGSTVTDLVIGSTDLPINKSIEVYYRDVTTADPYTPTDLGGATTLVSTRGRWILTSQSASLILFNDKSAAQQSLTLPNGYIMKTGTITTCARGGVDYTFNGTTTTLESGPKSGGDLVSGNYTASVVFTTAFPTALVSVFPIFKTVAGNNITTSIRTSDGSIAKTGFTIEFSETSSSVQQIYGIMWQAIGY